jgi:tRNA (cmo5U34)-methyltransferase
VAQYHDDATRYLELIRAGLPAYDALQDALVAATLLIGDAPRILDLGTGTGETALRCLAAHPGASVVAVDANPAMLAVARERLPAAAVLREGRLEDPPPAGPFDLVVSALALHHLEGAALAAAFARIAGVLAPGGRLVLADVVVAERPVRRPTPLDPAVDHPSRVADLLAGLGEAGLAAEVTWAREDLRVICAAVPVPGVAATAGQAAQGDGPAALAPVLGAAFSPGGRHAVVVLEAGGAPHQVVCDRVPGGWRARSAADDAGWTRTAPEGRDRGVATCWCRAPRRARAAVVRFGGVDREVALTGDWLVHAEWDVPGSLGDAPRVIDFR